MDGSRIDAWTRRHVGVLGAGVLALALGVGTVADATAKKRKKKLKRNRFGCVNVGGKCRGKDRACCSGICDGRKPRQGHKDASRCKAHDASTCRAGQHPNECGGVDDLCVTSLGNTGVCATTTGNAGYCFNTVQLNGPCRRDADCQGDLGAAAACIVCPDSDTTRCVTFGMP